MEKVKFNVGDTVVCSRFDGSPGFNDGMIIVLDNPLPVTRVSTAMMSVGPLYEVGGWWWPESALALSDASIGVGSYVRIQAEDLSRPSWKPINVYEVTEVSDCGGRLVIEHPEFDWEPRTINISDVVLHNEYTTPTETVVGHFTDDEDELTFQEIADGIVDLLEYKNKQYGNSALKPVNIFNGKSAVGQRIDDKLARIKNSKHLRINDIVDTLGYLILVCKENGWSDFSQFKD